VREINVSRAGDPVHAGDKALTRETPFIDCCLSSSDQHFSYIYDKSISEFSPSKDYVKCNIQGTSQRSWSFHLCKCESECYNNDPRSLQLHFHYWFSYLLTLPLQAAKVNITGVLGIGLSEIVACYVDNSLTREQCIRIAHIIGQVLEDHSKNN
jgi:hypothetical protein